MIQYVIANRSSRNPNGYADLVAYTRRDTLNGREHLVAAVTMLVRGVHQGSRGALFYSQEELKRCVDAWNGVPILLGHSASSGRNPDIINKYGVGVVFNTRFMLDRLRADAWLDIEKLRRLAPEALGMIERKQQIEVSTGFNSSFDDSPGVYNGRQYTASVVGIRPDHLAIFVNGEVGACSVRDGCGIHNLANELQGQRGDCDCEHPLSCSCNPPTPLGLPAPMEFPPLRQQVTQISKGTRVGRDRPTPLGLPTMEFYDETIAKAKRQRR